MRLVFHSVVSLSKYVTPMACVGGDFQIYRYGMPTAFKRYFMPPAFNPDGVYTMYGRIFFYNSYTLYNSYTPLGLEGVAYPFYKS
jgi:hypothetical protein